MKAILTDITMCVGCRRCVSACRKENVKQAETLELKAKPAELGDTRWTTIVQKPQQHFVRKHCRHCLNPACVAVCPVGALTKSNLGPILYNKRRCIGCRYCMMACPFSIPRYQWSSLVPGITKCTMCHHRIKEGKETACTEACLEKATIFGDRKSLLKEARKRIAANKQGYLPIIVGEKGFGGTGVLYVTDISLDFLTYHKNLTDHSPVELSWNTLKLTPVIAGGVAVTMTGIQWLIQRRMKLHNNPSKEKS